MHVPNGQELSVTFPGLSLLCNIESNYDDSKMFLPNKIDDEHAADYITKTCKACSVLRGGEP